MKHVINTRWLANPSQGRIHFPHESLYASLIHYQSGDALLIKWS